MKILKTGSLFDVYEDVFVSSLKVAESSKANIYPVYKKEEKRIVNETA